MISIDGYADVVRIGRGGLGDVYRATQLSTGGSVAIKVLRDVSDESVAWHRTRRELTALVSLAGHANVIQLLEVLDLPEGPALVMEYAPGGSVAELMLRRDRPLTVGETALVGRQTAAALIAAHARGIVHRDVKPQNLLIDAYGQVKLCDFGIAAMARTDEFRTRTSAISMRYASPEDLDDDVEVGPPSDVYSLAAAMLHMARGAPPTLKERLAPWVPPPTDDEHLATLDAVIASCLHPSPGERPTAAEVAEDLERLGWTIDERNRALAFEAVDLTDSGDAGTDDAPTDPARGRERSGAEGRDGAIASAIAALGGDAASLQGGRVDESTAAPATAADDGDRTESRPAGHPARPEPIPRRRRWPVVLGVSAVAAVVGFVAWPGGDDPPSIDVVDRPTGLSDIRELDWPIGAVGECLTQRDDTLAAVPCNEPHDLQRFAVDELDQFDATARYDADAIGSEVTAACDAAFGSFVGVAPSTSELEVATSFPSAAGWTDEGDRTFQCLLGIAGRRITGDAASSRR